MTTLSEAIRTHEPKIQGTAPIDDGRNAVEIVDIESFEKVRQIAVTLAEACENYTNDYDLGIITLEDALTTAKKLMEE